MISSMTGFGSGIATAAGIQVRVELRSVNSRFLDLQVRCPAVVQEVEKAVKERLQKRIGRGKVAATIHWEEEEESRPLPVLDEEVAGAYIEQLRQLQELGGLEGRADLSMVVGLPGLFPIQGRAVEPQQARQLILQGVDRALEDFERMRQEEGEALERDLRGRLEAVGRCLEQVEALAGQVSQQIQTRLHERLQELLQPGKVDEERLAMEVALLAEKSDITEELVRFKSHNDQFAAALDKGGEVGRRLNFLLQEMHREANTISSKSNDARVVHLVVEIKEEVERLREQVQNLA
ncbi:MAG: YicC family protein [Candidatus Latescibacteria bacterium]|nr:YicC family protein [Candidatus Latescibacterota bacterium]